MNSATVECTQPHTGYVRAELRQTTYRPKSWTRTLVTQDLSG